MPGGSHCTVTLESSVTKSTYAPGDRVEVRDETGFWADAVIREGDDHNGYKVDYTYQISGHFSWPLTRIRASTRGNPK